VSLGRLASVESGSAIIQSSFSVRPVSAVKVVRKMLSPPTALLSAPIRPPID
jgi:hypothetical protein